ncbi:MAG: hypothetical protein ACYS0H_26450 [Planctomycetota bacterium]
MNKKSSRRDVLCAAFLVLLTIAVTYAPLLKDRFYYADDYLFLADVARHGLGKALWIPYNIHFLPLYRLVMGGSYFISTSAAPIHAIVLTFHLINSYIIFRIVHARTDSIVLSILASATFGLSFQAYDCIIWCTSGLWVMSLTFILLMYLQFEKLIHDYESSDIFLQPPCGPIAQNACEKNQKSKAGISRSLNDYFAGIAFFILSIGFFTIGFVAGIIVWPHMYIRLYRKPVFRREAGYLRTKIILPFFAIAVLYIIAWSFLILRFRRDRFPLLSSPISLKEKILMLVHISPDFLLTALRGMVPYFQQHYVFILGLVVILLAWHIVSKTKWASQIMFWLIFAFLILAFPVVSRYPSILKHFGDPIFALGSRYYYFPLAGISIALGLLFAPFCSLKGIAQNVGRTSRLVLGIVFVVALFALNLENIVKIRHAIKERAEANLAFHGRIQEHRNAMDAFLHSSSYRPDETYYFIDSEAASVFRYPSSLFVRKSDLFYLFYSQYRNIQFVAGNDQGNERTYVWTPETVVVQRELE